MKKFFERIKNITMEKKMNLLIMFLLISCFIKNDSGIKDITDSSNSQLKFEKKYENQLNNFVFLVKMITTPMESITYSTASGTIISSTNSHIFVLTANHFCKSESEIIPFNPEILIWNQNNVRFGHVLYSDSENDICILTGIKYKKENFKNLKFADEMPTIGEFTFNVSAPNGMSSPEVKLMFDGYFAGCEKKSNICFYSIPSTYGSSGSSVYNKKGELISIIVMANPEFENVGLGPDIYIIKNSIKQLEKIMVIKWNYL